MSIDEKTFREIYDLYFDGIRRFLSYYSANPELIEDIIQDVFVKLWLERKTTDIKHIKTYLYTSARNKILNHLRDERNRLELLRKWSENERITRKEDKDETESLFVQMLRSAIDNLPNKCKEIYLLSREERFTYQEIASSLLISVKTVEAQMGIALKKIRCYLHDNKTNKQ